MSQKATERIPLTPDTRDRIKDFKHGFGGRYDDALEYLLDLVVHPGESDYEAGKRIRAQRKRR